MPKPRYSHIGARCPLDDLEKAFYSYNGKTERRVKGLLRIRAVRKRAGLGAAVAAAASKL